MCFKLPKDTNLKCAKICQKIRKSLPWQQCFIKSPSEELRSACLNAYPRQMESKTSRGFAKYSAVSYGKSQAKAGCQLKLGAFYI